MSVTYTACPECQAPNHPTARWCVKCAHPLAAEANLATPAAPAPMEFVFDDDEHSAAGPARQRSRCWGAGFRPANFGRRHGRPHSPAATGY